MIENVTVKTDFNIQRIVMKCKFIVGWTESSMELAVETVTFSSHARELI